MCYERWMRRDREADDSRELWRDFERTRPIAEPSRPEDVTEPERAEAREASAVAAER